MENLKITKKNIQNINRKQKAYKFKLLRKVFSLVLLFLVLTYLINGLGVNTLFAINENPYVLIEDKAGLFSENELDEIYNKALDVAANEKEGFIINIYTTDDAKGKSSMMYGDDRFEAINDRSGFDLDGVYFILDTDNVYYYMGTFGYAINALTDDKVEAVLEDMYPGIREKDYYLAVMSGLNSVESHLKDYASRYVKKAGFGGIGGAIAAFFTAGFYSKKVKREYDKFEAKPAYNFDKESEAVYDVFEDKIIDRHSYTVYSPVSSSSSGGGGSRSSTHTTSGGRTSGGGGRIM